MSYPQHEDPHDDQARLLRVYGRFQGHDLTFLRLQGADELAEQVKARQALGDYLAELYEWVKYGLGSRTRPRPPSTPPSPGYSSRRRAWRVG
jgi:hypothetical protein